MVTNVLRSLIENDKGELRNLRKWQTRSSYADEMEALTDEQLQAKTAEFKERYNNGESLDDLLYEAYAVVREGARRVLGLYPTRFRLWENRSSQR